VRINVLNCIRGLARKYSAENGQTPEITDSRPLYNIRCHEWSAWLRSDINLYVAIEL